MRSIPSRAIAPRGRSSTPEAHLADALAVMHESVARSCERSPPVGEVEPMLTPTAPSLTGFVRASRASESSRLRIVYATRETIV